LNDDDHVKSLLERWDTLNYSIFGYSSISYQKDHICTPNGDKVSCNIGQAPAVKLMQEDDKK
jgi:hypothetical protein